MIRFKTFFGTMNGTTAADYLNNWLEENKTVEVIDFKYQQARFGDHSILAVSSIWFILQILF